MNWLLNKPRPVSPWAPTNHRRVPSILPTAEIPWICNRQPSTATSNLKFRLLPPFLVLYPFYPIVSPRSLWPKPPCFLLHCNEPSTIYKIHRHVIPCLFMCSPWLHLHTGVVIYLFIFIFFC